MAVFLLVVRSSSNAHNLGVGHLRGRDRARRMGACSMFAVCQPPPPPPTPVVCHGVWEAGLREDVRPGWIIGGVAIDYISPVA
jgi:hypothetical protein